MVTAYTSDSMFHLHSVYRMHTRVWERRRKGAINSGGSGFKPHCLLFLSDIKADINQINFISISAIDPSHFGSKYIRKSKFQNAAGVAQAFSYADALAVES